MIGATSEELQDNKFTPFFYYNSMKRKIPGVEMHANALNTILNNDFINRLNSVIQFFIALVLAAIAMIIARHLKPYIGLASCVMIFSMYAVCCHLLFTTFNILVSFFVPILCFIISYGVNTVHQVLNEQQQKGFYRKTFQQYISKNVVDTMLSSGKLPKFGGERKALTVLFSDIRSFTTFSEKHTAEMVVDQLSEYLSAMVDVIFRHQGTLDKFVGDEIMAVFGAPYYYENHAERACRTALDMVAELKKLQHKWIHDQKDIFHIGIGINTGKVIVGNLGSVQLFDYTVIGDEVNLGARLEGANKNYSTTIIISETTYNQVKKNAVVRELDYVCVKGKTKPVRIYELLGMYDFPLNSEQVISENFSLALDEFKKRRWYIALKKFRDILRDYPDDGPSKLYTQRCLDFIKNPPPDDWNGVFEFKTK
jgi:adenylate cyclase